MQRRPDKRRVGMPTRPVPVVTLGGGGMLSSGSSQGALLGIRFFTEGTAQTYTPTEGTNKILFFLVGGGGGGGGVSASGSNSAGAGGGGAGAWIRKWIEEVAESYTYTIGGGGNGGAAGNNNGSSGTGSSLTDGTTTWNAHAGLAGAGMAFGTAVAAALGAEQSTTPTGGDANVAGEGGNPGFRLSGTVCMGGKGGSSPWGSGGSVSANNAGLVGSGYGAGGGGGMSVNGVAKAGGKGAGGMLLIFEYS